MVVGTGQNTAIGQIRWAYPFKPFICSDIHNLVLLSRMCLMSSAMISSQAEETYCVGMPWRRPRKS